MCGPRCGALGGRRVRSCFVSQLVVSVEAVSVLPVSELLSQIARVPAAESRSAAARIYESTADREDIRVLEMKVSLVCPISQKRIVSPARGSACQHVQCFDAETYLLMNERRPSWRCTICLRPLPFNQLTVDECVRGAPPGLCVCTT